MFDINLFLCTTPLQVKLAEFIANNYVNGDFKIVYLLEEGFEFDDISWSKQKYYVDKCDELIKWNHSKINEIILDLNLRYKCGSVYYASFDNFFIRLFVENNPDVKCYGFDDGLASIYPKGIYSKPFCDYLKDKIVLHYSLYNCGYHVIIESKLVYLDTSNVFNIKTLNPEGDELVVFLGEEILANPEIGFNFNQQYVDKIKPDWYIPHPRARFQIEYDRILNSNLLFEDLVNEWQLLYSKIIVYHFSSSVSVHLNNIEGIEFRGISCYPLKERQAEMEKYGLSFNKLDLDFKI